jgi:hypothetical protein
VIHRDHFDKHSTLGPNDGSFRWFNPSTDQTITDVANGGTDTCPYNCWLSAGASSTPPVILGVALAKVDHAQSHFPSQSAVFGQTADHLIMDAQCGKTWLSYLQAPRSNNFGGTHSPLNAIEIATWDDYDEGTEMETGVDNCMSSLSSSITGSTLSWTIAFNAPGDQSTIDHYAVFYSTDGSTGQNLTELADVAVTPASSSYTYSLPSNLPNPTVVYVKAVGKPMVTNHMSAGTLFAPNPPAPGRGTVTITGFEQSDENGNCDSGVIYVVVNGVESDTPYGSGGGACDDVLPGFYAQYLVNTINQGNPYVSAQWNGDYNTAVITLTARTSGANTNYSLSSGSYSQSSPIFNPPSYTATPSGSTLTGGHN